MLFLIASIVHSIYIYEAKEMPESFGKPEKNNFQTTLFSICSTIAFFIIKLFKLNFYSLRNSTLDFYLNAIATSH